MIEIMSAFSANTSRRSSGVLLDIPHCTIRSHESRTAWIAGGQSSACMCRIAAPASAQRLASAAMSSAVSGNSTAGSSQHTLGVAVTMSGGLWSVMNGLPD